MLETGPIAGGTFKAWGNRPKFAGITAASSSRGEVCRTLHLEENRVGDQPSESVIGRVGWLECGL